MVDTKMVSTPMVTHEKLTRKDESALVNPTRYKSMIVSLLYLTQTRPDIMNAICIASSYQSDPRENHESVVKRIFRYLQGTFEYGLWYPKDDDFTFCAYIDIDWVGHVDDWKTTSGGAFFLGKKLVSWINKKQSCTSLSTVEAEYVVDATNCTQVLCMNQMLKDIKVYCTGPVVIHYDNIATIDISKNQIFYSKTNHISINYNFLKEKVEENEVQLVYVNTKEQIIDIFTKPLPKESFEYLRDRLGVSTPPIEN